MQTRREVLQAAVAMPLAASVAGAPLSLAELRVLAMCATPSSTWDENRDEYNKTRVDAISDDQRGIVRCLERRGLVAYEATPDDGYITGFYEATSAGIEALEVALLTTPRSDLNIAHR